MQAHVCGAFSCAVLLEWRTYTCGVRAATILSHPPFIRPDIVCPLHFMRANHVWSFSMRRPTRVAHVHLWCPCGNDSLPGSIFPANLEPPCHNSLSGTHDASISSAHPRSNSLLGFRCLRATIRFREHTMQVFLLHIRGAICFGVNDV